MPMKDDASAERRALLAIVDRWSAQVAADARALRRRRWCRRHVANGKTPCSIAVSAGRSKHGGR